MDGVYLKAVLEKQKAALLIAIGGLSDGRGESNEGWPGMLRDLRDHT